MSRIIVKNLPDIVDVNKIREKFSEIGHVTDLQLKFTPQGKFRKFGFIGYENSEQANKAVEHFNKTYFGTSRLQVEFCNELGDSNKPKAWSKYSAESNAFKKVNEKNTVNGKEKDEKKTNKDKKTKKTIRNEEVLEQLKKYKDDPEFIEFMELHGKADKIREINQNEETTSNNNEEEETKKELDIIARSAISDLEYLKSKMKGSNPDAAAKIIKDDIRQPEKQRFFTVKINNLPYTVKKKDIRSLLNPLTPASIRLPPTVKGIAYVGFETEKEKRKALIKNKTFLNGRQLLIVDYQYKEDGNTSQKNRWKEQEEALKHEEDVGESGRIFIRNLSYSVTEDEVQNMFSKYGPIAEIILPVDKSSRQVKGYGIITFVMPEHAVAAYTALDGTVFHGRMLHLLPARAKDNEEENTPNEETNFKAQKMKKLKAKAGSSHNWNTLFLDLNAVAEVIAKKYNVTKEDVMTGSEAAVRLALGETQLVSEAKKFLEENGVKLDAFNQEVKKRSKTIILVKNLPANTTVSEIRNLFIKYGELGRVILPPSGITGLIEFLEPSEARIAFKHLAYTKFKYLPLYLEWAPDDSFVTEDDKEKIKKEKANKEEKGQEEEQGKEEKKEDNEIDNSEEEDIVPETNATLFVKNLHFDTTEDNLKEHFKKYGKIACVTIARKKDPKLNGKLLSMGYGFVHFYSTTALNEAMRDLEGSQLLGHKLELKKSNKTLPKEILTRKRTNVAKQTGTKIMVRNIPFQVTTNEIRDIFKIFGELKFVRLPKKLVGTGSHRGFGFVEFVSKNDAKRAMLSLCQSTHLLGRRLVLEWADNDTDVTELRKRTAKHFHADDDIKKKSKIIIPEKENDDELMDDMMSEEMEF